MWIFLLVLFLLAGAATVLTETEKFGWATLLLIVCVAVAQLFHVVDLLDWVKTHSLQTVLYTVAYVGVGVVWSFVKWFSFLMSFRDKYRSLRETFLKGLHGVTIDVNGPVPESYQKDFESFIASQRTYVYKGTVEYDNPLGAKPRASKNKARIVSWMSLWPCSVIGTVLNDPVRRLFNLVFNWFKGLYQKMSDHIFAKDLELK